MNLDIEEVKKLMEQDFTKEKIQKIKELCRMRIKKTYDSKVESGNDKINNWAGHLSRDYFENKASELFPGVGIEVIRNKFKSYEYNEYRTENFRFYQMLLSANNPFRLSDLTMNYIIRDPEILLFPEYDNKDNDDKYPCFLIYEKEEGVTELKSVKICMRNEDGWIEELSYNLYPVYGLKSEEPKISETPVEENVPSAAGLLKFKPDEKNRKDA